MEPVNQQHQTARGREVACDREAAVVGRLLSMTQARVHRAPFADAGAPAQHFTAGQLARILEVPIGRIHLWLRHGLLQSMHSTHRLHWFEFRQLVCARSLRDLTRAGARLTAIARAVRQFTERDGGAMTTEQALAQLQICEGRLMWRREDGQLSELNGQLHLDFAAPEAMTSVQVRAATMTRSAGDWFELGVEAEAEDDLDLALSAYGRAVALAPERPDHHFNLANVYYSLGRWADAIRAYAAAVERDPDYAEAWNNVGNVLCEVGQFHVATEVYRRALEIEPAYADAHYNLAETLADRGDIRGAHEHWRAYLRLDPHSAWSMQVRDRLRGGSGRAPRLAARQQKP